MKRSLLVMFVFALAAAALLWQPETGTAPQGPQAAAPAVGPPASMSVARGEAAPLPTSREEAVVPAAEPARDPVVLQRAARVRGVVRGGEVKAYARRVLLWRVDDDERMRTPHQSGSGAKAFVPRTCEVDAAGGFFADALEPGSWYALLSRSGGASVRNRPDEQVDVVPLVDEDLDFGRRQQFEAVAGVETLLDLVDPPLGVLRGRVLLGGEPFAGAKIVASRAGWARSGWRPRLDRSRNDVDWDDDLDLGSVPGQHTGADGTFMFLYRDAGDLELRVRHPNGAATSTPTIVSLPPPGAPVVRDVVMPGGGIRGRFPVDALPELGRKCVTVVLFPMHKAALDPVASGDWDPGVEWGCTRMDLPADGAFAFSFLSAGHWLVRIYDPGYRLLTCSTFGFGGRVHWQRVIAVRDAVVDLADLELPPCVPATFGWQWAPRAPAKDAGSEVFWVHESVGLFQAHGSDAAAVWVHTFARDAVNRTVSVPAGDYVLAPMSFRYREGDGIAVKVAADGTVTPSLVTFPPAAPAPADRR